MDKYLFPDEFIKKSRQIITQEVIDSQGITISNGKSTIKIPNTKEGVEILRKKRKKS